MTREAAARFFAVACAAHAAVVVILFADVLFLGRLPYLRDVSTYYYPDYVFAASALRHGVWPLWNPTADAGAPFLMAYPVDLLMLAGLGARRTLMLSPPLHVWLGMCGATALAHELGWRPRAAWLSGAVYGLSGCAAVLAEPVRAGARGGLVAARRCLLPALPPAAGGRVRRAAGSGRGHPPEHAGRRGDASRRPWPRWS